MSGKALCLASIIPYMLERLPPGEKIPSPWKISRRFFCNESFINHSWQTFLSMSLWVVIYVQNGLPYCHVNTNNWWVTPSTELINNSEVEARFGWQAFDLAATWSAQSNSFLIWPSTLCSMMMKVGATWLVITMTKRRVWALFTSKVWMLVLRASDSQDPATPYSSAPWYN